MTITQTITFDDLIDSVQTELDDLREQYDDTVALIEQEWGADALDRPLPADAPADAPDDDTERLAGLRMTAYLYEESAKQLQKRTHALETLRDEYDGGRFTIRMLSGQDTLELETQVRAKARELGVDVDEVQHYRKGLVVDEATVDAPDGVPRSDGSPEPSAVGNALMFALYEQIEALNSAGAADFRAPGFDGPDLSVAGSSATPTPSADSSKPSAPTDDSTPPRGEDS